MPGSDHGIPDWTPTIADLLKEQGYATGQFGKNHLGDRDYQQRESKGGSRPPALVSVSAAVKSASRPLSIAFKVNGMGSSQRWIGKNPLESGKSQYR